MHRSRHPGPPGRIVRPGIAVPAADALPRRRFVQGLAAGGVLLGLGGTRSPAFAQTAGGTHTGSAPELRGTEFDLVLAHTPVNFTGRERMATTVNGSLPGPVLRWREGDTVTIRVTNRMAEQGSIHWHGILLPFEMDGVPGVSFAGIDPGQTFTYRFKVRQAGTYWYHSHSAMQENTGLYGALVIDPADPQRQIRADRDYVVQLSDWSDEDPMRILLKLRSQGDTYNVNRPTLPHFVRDTSRYGLAKAVQLRRMWNEMRMNPTDLADVSGQTLTYLMNGVTPAGNWTGLFRRGETVRLRFVNAAAHTFYDVRIPGQKLRVVQADGEDVEPVTVDEFRFGPGETYDVLVQPDADACTIFAQTMDRTGYARGTLAVAAGLDAAVPAVDPVRWLSMGDMMGAMDHGGHGAHGAHGDANHEAGRAGNAADSGAAVAAGTAGAAGAADGGHAAHGAAAGHAAMDHGTMNHAAAGAASGLARAGTTVRHARTEWSATTDMRVDMPRTNLDDPGVGLRDTGRRALTLADLHTIGGPLDPRGAEREIELHLTGNMERYAWSIDGLEFAQSAPVHFHYGERLRVILHNDTMMTHPMHLHGMWSELEAPDGSFVARRHTIPVQSAQRISFLVTAEALGRWVWHCHLMFHMDMGMFREVVVS